MNLLTLGRLELNGSDFAERQPLLLLGYMALEKRELRGELADLFWMHQERRDLRLKALSEALRKLKKVSPELVNTDHTRAQTNVKTDIELFLTAFGEGRLNDALAHYRGPFLEGIERSKRLHLATELLEWIVNQREALQAKVLDIYLVLGERAARHEKFDEAADHAWRAFSLNKDIAYPGEDDYERMHTLLLAGGRSQDAVLLQMEAADIYGERNWSTHEQEARARLTFSLNLPPTTSTFVGRKAELTTLTRWLTIERNRLVTIAGVGGVGKTEVALSLVRTLRPHFPDGVFFISFTEVGTDMGVDAFIRKLADGLTLKPGAAVEDIHAFLGAKHVLLILDNLEHLRSHFSLLPTLLQACPDLHILATSRERLHLQNETLLRLLGLPCEQAEKCLSLELLQLRAEHAGYPIARDMFADALRIVRAVDGLPLAIELAASWLGAFSPAQVAHRLEQDLDFLAEQDSDRAGRHRSIKVVFDVSYDLLSSKQKEALKNLSVFASAFAFGAAEAVCGVTPALIKSLIDKSLLRFDRGTELYRFHLLVHSYAKAKFTDESVHEKHARYFLDKLLLVMHKNQDVKNKALNELSGMAQDLFSAWRYAVSNCWQGELFKAIPMLRRFCDNKALYQEGIDLFLMTTVSADDNDFVSKKHANQAWLTLRLGRYDETITLAEQALASTTDKQTASLCLDAIGAAYESLGLFKMASIYFEKVVESAVPNSREEAGALTNLAISAIKQGNYSEAKEKMDRACDIYTQLGKREVLVWVEYWRGRLHLEQSNAFKACALLEKALAGAVETDQRHWILNIKAYLAMTYLSLGNLDMTLALCHDVLSDERRNKIVEVVVFSVLADLEIKKDNHAEASSYINQGLQKGLSASSHSMLLSLFTRQLKIYIAMGDNANAARLYGYLKAEGNSEKLVFSDQIVLADLIEEIGRTLQHYTSSQSDWSELSLEEVAFLIIGDARAKKLEDSIAL